MDAFVVLYDVQSFAFLKSIDNSGPRLEVTHPLERVDNINWDWKVFVSFDFGKKEFVLEEIRVGEVKFDLSSLA